MAISPNYEIPERHRAFLLRMCGLPPLGVVPDPVAKQYLIARQAADRISMPVTDHDLLTVVLTSRQIQEPDPPQAQSVVDMYRQGQLKHGDRVFCQWRKEANKEAVLLNVDANDRVVVRFVGKPEEYKLPADQVAVAAV